MTPTAHPNQPGSDAGNRPLKLVKANSGVTVLFGIRGQDEALTDTLTAYGWAPTGKPGAWHMVSDYSHLAHDRPLDDERADELGSLLEDTGYQIDIDDQRVPTGAVRITTTPHYLGVTTRPNDPTPAVANELAGLGWQQHRGGMWTHDIVDETAYSPADLQALADRLGERLTSAGILHERRHRDVDLETRDMTPAQELDYLRRSDETSAILHAEDLERENTRARAAADVLFQEVIEEDARLTIVTDEIIAKYADSSTRFDRNTYHGPDQTAFDRGYTFGQAMGDHQLDLIQQAAREHEWSQLPVEMQVDIRRLIDGRTAEQHLLSPNPRPAMRQWVQTLPAERQQITQAGFDLAVAERASEVETERLRVDQQINAPTADETRIAAERTREAVTVWESRKTTTAATDHPRPTTVDAKALNDLARTIASTRDRAEQALDRTRGSAEPPAAQPQPAAAAATPRAPHVAR